MFSQIYRWTVTFSYIFSLFHSQPLTTSPKNMQITLGGCLFASVWFHSDKNVWIIQTWLHSDCLVQEKKHLNELKCVWMVQHLNECWMIQTKMSDSFRSFSFRSDSFRFCQTAPTKQPLNMNTYMHKNTLNLCPII